MITAHRCSAVLISLSYFQKAVMATTICSSIWNDELVVKDICRDGYDVA
jgi:hypothetical protein